MTTKKSIKNSFEHSMKQLADIVKQMEQGGLPLADSLRLFAEGVTLAKQCRETTKAAEQKIKILTEGHLSDFKTTDLGEIDEEEE